MKSDIEKTKTEILTYLPLIQQEYNISAEKINEIIKSIDKRITYGDEGISFHVINGILYLPRIAYSIIDELKKHELYGSTTNTGVKVENYLQTDNTYRDYINHMITDGYNAMDYFMDSLLHETMHMCGGRGGTSLEEGINELKTRQLAQKYNIKIAAVGYNKEVEIAQLLETILGKETMDIIAFLSDEQIKEYLCTHHTDDEIKLYYDVKNTMKKEGAIYQTQTIKTNNPFEKAEGYDSMEYTETKKIISKYIKSRMQFTSNQTLEVSNHSHLR